MSLSNYINALFSCLGLVIRQTIIFSHMLNMHRISHGRSIDEQFIVLLFGEKVKTQVKLLFFVESVYEFV